MSNASDLRAELRSLFADYGETLTVQRVTPGAYDPATGATATSTTTSQTGVGRLGSYSDYATDGTIIKQNDRRVTFVSDDPAFEPQINDRLVSGADVYTIMSLKPRELNGDWDSWTMQVRR